MTSKKAAPQEFKVGSGGWFILVLLFIAIIIIYVIADQLSQKPAIRQYCQTTRKFILGNETQWSELFTDIFDQAKACQNNKTCQQHISQLLNQRLQGKEEVQFYESTYFIRLGSDRSIEKLFLSGEYRDRNIETNKEKKVVALLQNKRGEICDDGWKIDDQQTMMRYLYDLHSEAEILLPVKQGNKVIGAVVKAWGD